MTLNSVGLQVNAVLEDEGEYGHDQAIEEEVSEETYTDCAYDEERAGPPFEALRFRFGHCVRDGSPSDGDVRSSGLDTKIAPRNDIMKAAD